MNLNEIAYNLLNLIRGGRSGHDEHISLDQLKFNIKYYRAMFIRRDFARNGIVTRHFEQNLGCLKLKKMDAAQCCDFETGCAVYRTVLKIPKTVRFSFKDAITFVGHINGTDPITLVEAHMLKYVIYDRYTAHKPKAYMIGDYLYLYNPGDMEYVNIRGVFENPEDLKKYSCETGTCYDDDTSDFPVSMDMVALINQGILQGELQILSSSISDTINDRSQNGASDQIQSSGMNNTESTEQQ